MRERIYSKSLQIILLGCVWLMMGACSDFIEKDLTKKEVSLYAPGKGMVTEDTHVLFGWNEVEGTDKYSFQIASPSFQNNTRLLTDSLVSGVKFETNLAPGIYAWRVSARNSVSSTPYAESTFEIKQPFDISTQEVILSAPRDNQTSADASVTFKWNPVAGANKYVFRLKAGSWSSGDVVGEYSVYTNEIALSPGDGTYSWGVCAYDTIRGKNTAFVSRNLTIDTEPSLTGKTVTLLSPSDSLSTKSQSVTFWWEKLTGTTSYLFQLVTPSFSNVNLLVKEITQTDNTIQMSLQPGTYQWRVKALNVNSSTSYTTGTFVIEKP